MSTVGRSSKGDHSDATKSASVSSVGDIDDDDLFEDARETPPELSNDGTESDKESTSIEPPLEQQEGSNVVFPTPEPNFHDEDEDFDAICDNDEDQDCEFPLLCFSTLQYIGIW